MSIYNILKKTSTQITKKQEYEVIKIYHPGKGLSKKEISYVAAVVSKAKSHIFTKEYTQRQDLLNTIISADIFVVISFKRRLVACGFAKKYQEIDTTFLFSSFVRKTYQKKGIGKLLMKACIETNYFAFLTQTPLSYRLLQSISQNDTLYPNLENDALPENLLKRLQPIIKDLAEEYNRQTSIVTLMSGYSSFSRMPLSKNKNLNNWIYEKLYRDRIHGEEHLFLCAGSIK